MKGKLRGKVIGLTGPIAAGKSEVAKILKCFGAIVIEADEVAHQLYRPQTPIWRELIRTFGSKILKRGGEINRRKLADIVFSDRKKLLELNRIVHPSLKEAIIKMVEDLKVKSEDQKPIVISAAVLEEIGLLQYVDEVWVVMASKRVRQRRLMKTGLRKEEIWQRIDSQISQKEYLKMADVVIWNEGTKSELKKEVLNQFSKG